MKNAFPIHRSAVYAKHGMVAASQPYAVNAGLKILREGGNAIDAAIATAAALAVTEPCSTGLGGDCFLLFYEAKTKKVHALNGSGRSSTSLTLEKLKRDLGNTIDPTHPHFVTVPGTAKGWEDAILKWGTKSFYDVLYPAIEIASNGFPVSPITSFHWNRGVSKIITQNDAKRAQDLLISDTTKDTTPRGPNPGEIFKNPHMARVLTSLGKNGASKTFYDGPVGQAIVDAVQSAGGALTMDDLRKHRTDFPDAVKTRYRNIDVWEHPPNGQGLAALIALAILNEIDPSTFSSSPSSRLHVLIESMRLAFADARKYISDPSFDAKRKMETFRELLSPEYVKKRCASIDMKRAKADVIAGTPIASSDTVSFQVVDRDGNAVSMVNSNYQGFGTGIIPKNCGFTLQNRGFNFSLDPKHWNCFEGGKRPYHTIIPGMATFSDDGSLYASFTNMGGFMQPQGHLQLISNMIDFGMNPQRSIDFPRFCIADGTSHGLISLEEGISEDCVKELKRLGHRVVVVRGHERSVFGRAQIIIRDRKSEVLCGGSDCRADGMAAGLL